MQVRSALVLTLGVIIAAAGASADVVTPALQVHAFDEPRALTLDESRIALLVTGADGKAVATLDGEIGRALADAGIDVARAEQRAIAGWWVAPIDADARAGRSPLDIVRDAIASTDRIAGRGIGRVEFISPVFIDALGGPMHPTPQILVRFAPEVGADAIEEALGAANAGVIAEENWGGMTGSFRVAAASRNGAEVLAAANLLAQRPEVIYAEPDMVFTGRSEFIPNDPSFLNCWGLRNIGQFSGAVVDIDMNATEAWDTTLGSSSIITVIIDTGVQQNHPDINQIAGYDTTTDAGDGGPVNSFDNHGTAVAGCTSAIANNSLGTAGVAPGTRIVSARTFISVNSSGGWTSAASWTVNSLNVAASLGARVSNNSNAYGFTSSAIASAYAATRTAGMVHFASAGNDNVNTSSYPSSLSTVLSIGALNFTGLKSSFSNFGPLIAFIAPGSSVYTTDRTGSAGYGSSDYAYVQGTSFASPYAAGVAALLLSRCPDLTAAQVETKLFASCLDLGAPGRDDTYGEGLIRADQAISATGLHPCGFSLLSPANLAAGISRTPTLDWADAVWASTYDIEIKNNLSATVWTDTTATSLYTVPPGALGYSSTYTWEITAVNATGSTMALSGPFAFTTVPAPCPGDVNGDGFTNAADFTVLAGNFGSAVPPNTAGDLTGDGIVNAADFTVLAGDFGCAP